MQKQQKQAKLRLKIVGNYQLGKTIGTGTFATVKEAIHLPTQQKVAIKIINKKIIVDTRDKTNISREMRIIKKLRHPNIVQLLQIIQTSSKLYFVMEYVKKGELYDLIVKNATSRLSEQLASVYFQQLLHTVQYIHSLGITHRDLKPENIMIGDDMTIKITDFGLSNLYQTGEELTTPCGSPCYAAPEMLSQKSYCPLKGDIWSCGIILYTMLCGFLPFEHENTLEIYKLVQKGKYDEPKHLSSSAKDLLSKMLQPDPEKRLSLCQLRKHAFCHSSSQPIVKGLLPSEKIYVDSDIIEQMKTLGYSGFIKDIEQNIIGQNIAAFYLLLFNKLSIQKISLLEYFQKLVEIKSPFRSKSILIKKFDNPEELPVINKKNIVTLMNLTKHSRSIVRSQALSVSNPKIQSQRSLNMRVKRVVR